MQYDEHVREVSMRVKQLGPTKDDTDMALTRFEHVSLQFCVDEGTLEAAVALSYIKNVKTYDYLYETTLRAFLDSLVEDKKRACLSPKLTRLCPLDFQCS